jgi:tetratricopeptide (TPR) repeat protein
MGRHAEALTYANRALNTDQGQLELYGRGMKLHTVALVLENMGRYEETLARLDEAYDIQRAVGNTVAATNTLVSVARVHWKLGDHAIALDYIEQALAAEGEHTHGHGAAIRRRDIGLLLREIRGFDAARRYWEEALSILNELDAPEATHVKSLLNEKRRPR